MVSIQGTIAKYSWTSETQYSWIHKITLNRDSVSAINQIWDNQYEVVVKISENSGYIYVVDKKDYETLITHSTSV
jgi:hypothetical protein